MPRVWHSRLLCFDAMQDNAAPRQAEVEETPAETGTALAGRQTLEVLSGAERIADALELAATEADRLKARIPSLPCWLCCALQMCCPDEALGVIPYAIISVVASGDQLLVGLTLKPVLKYLLVDLRVWLHAKPIL